jgi:hypothetical protein
MKVAAALVSLMVAAMAVTGGAASAQTATQDSVTGSAGAAGTQFGFEVHSGPSGENPTGTITISAVGTFEVACLSVSANRASMSFRLPNVAMGFVGGVISVEDNDGAGQDRLDGRFVTTLPSECPVPSEVVNPIFSGDITVTDTQPFPISKGDCKHGGWRTYVVFKNQGDCVSFVATGAKNPPGKKTG